MSSSEDEGAKPKDTALSSKLFTKDNIQLLEAMFPEMDPNTLSSFLFNYPGKFLEGLIERLLENNSRIKCGICWEMFLIEDTMSCGRGHLFCRACGKTGLEQQFRDGREGYVCLSPDCNLEIDLPLLQSIIEVKMFTKHVQNLCLSEVKKVPNLTIEYCPQCNFGVEIEDRDVKVIECKYEYCKARSCRACSKPAHPPGVLCITDERLKVQHEAENMLTEAVVRKCRQCKKVFQKFDGCNRIQCTCGAQMCYVCKRVITQGYDHFYNTNEVAILGQCPLQANPDDLHKMERASAAKGAVSLLDPRNTLHLSSNPILKD